MIISNCLNWHSLQYPALRVLHPAGADGNSQVDEGAPGCHRGGGRVELKAGSPFCQDPTRSQLSKVEENMAFLSTFT